MRRRAHGKMTAKLGKTTVWDVDRREHIIFLALVFVFYFFWSLAQPPLAAPDEGMRYQIPQFIFENGYLPHGAEEAIRNPQWGISYGFAPYISQILGVPLMKITLKSRNAQGEVLEYGTAFCLSNYFNFDFRVKLQSASGGKPGSAHKKDA